MNAFVASLPTSFAGPAASPACAAITPSSHAGFRQCAVPARMHHMPVMRSHCATALSPSPSSSSSPSFFSSAAFGTAVPQQTQQLQQQQQQELPELQSQPHQPNTPTTRVQPRMDVTVVVGENEPVESALRRFKRDVSKSGHLFELRRRRYFETNTEKRLRKAVASRRKAKIARQASRKQKH